MELSSPDLTIGCRRSHYRDYWMCDWSCPWQSFGKGRWLRSDPNFSIFFSFSWKRRTRDHRKPRSTVHYIRYGRFMGSFADGDLPSTASPSSWTWTRRVPSRRETFEAKAVAWLWMEGMRPPTTEARNESAVDTRISFLLLSSCSQRWLS